jgi:hypothetical protein
MLITTYFLYASILFFSTVFVYFSEKSKSIVANFAWLFLSFLWLFIPAAIRYGIGTDYYSYELIYNRVFYGIETRVEPLWYLVNYIFNNYLGVSFQVLVTFTSFVTYLFLYLSYRVEKAWLLHFGFITILYLYTYSNLRSGIVYSLVFYIFYILLLSDIKFTKAKKIYLSLSLVSFFIHYSSVLLILLYPFFNHRALVFLNKKYTIYFVISLSVFILFVGASIAPLIVNSSLSESFGYDIYSSSDIYYLKESASIGYVGFIKAAILLSFLFYRKRIYSHSPKAVYLLPFALFNLLIVSLAASVQIVLRLEILFSFTYIFSLYYLFLTYGKKLTILVWFFIAVLFFSFFRNIYNWTYNPVEKSSVNIAPYVSIFNKEDAF